MGRAIVRDPQVFLFDEPLSNLDAKLRVAMRAEIKELHQRLGTTIVYVTHDQIEAMTMADKIVVMHDGSVEQIGAPLELYDSPANVFVAGFIGSPAMNFIKGRIDGGDGERFSFRTRDRCCRPRRQGAERPAGHLRHTSRAYRHRARRPAGNGFVLEPTGSETQVFASSVGTDRRHRQGSADRAARRRSEARDRSRAGPTSSTGKAAQPRVILCHRK